MTIILGIIGVIVAIFLVVLLFQVLLAILGGVLYLIGLTFQIIAFLFKPAIVIGILFLAYQLAGIWGLIILVLISLLFYQVGNIRKRTLENQMRKIFLKYEMSSFEDLQSNVGSRYSREEINETLQIFITEGKLEEIDFGRGAYVYRWTEKRRYSHGVMTEHITVD